VHFGADYDRRQGFGTPEQACGSPVQLQKVWIWKDAFLSGEACLVVRVIEGSTNESLVHNGYRKHVSSARIAEKTIGNSGMLCAVLAVAGGFCRRRSRTLQIPSKFRWLVHPLKNCQKILNPLKNLLTGIARGMKCQSIYRT
jgi:hypothetical protein